MERARALLPMLFVGALVALPALAAGGMGMGTMSYSSGPMYPQASDGRQLRMREALVALRDEGLKLRAADGGTLTPEHLVYLQKKLDAIRAGNF